MLQTRIYIKDTNNEECKERIQRSLFFFKAGLEVNPVKCMRGKKIPQHVLFKPSFYTSLFSFIRLCSFSSSDTTATSSKKKQKHSSPPLQISQVRPLAYVADQSYAAFSAPPHPGSSIKNNIACTVRIAPFSAQLSLNKSTRSPPVSSARTTAAGFCFCCYSVY